MNAKINRSRMQIGSMGILVIFMLLLAACAPAAAAAPTQAPAPSSAPAATLAPAPTTAPTVAAATQAVPNTGSGAVTVNVAADPKLGNILVDGKGMTLYIFTKDGPDKSTCAGGCAKSWPVLTVQGSPAAGTGVDASLLGTAALPDGSMIVTYNKMPLYTFAKDSKAGDTNGQQVGGVWFVVAPDGKPVGMESGTPAAASTAANTSATAQPTAMSSAAGPAMVNLATDPKLGKILVDAKGMTLYVFTKDGPDKPTCAGGCAKIWPAFTTQGSPTAGTGVDASLLGTAALPDGSMIVTYNKMPLYTFASDSQAGDTKGQGVGSVWFVVAPDGKMVGQ
jgi:predicted lipoprotein with Yx(FWY)xxD motif